MNADKEALREQLSEEAYRVTQEGATEPPFTGAYYKTKDDRTLTPQVARRRTKSD